MSMHIESETLSGLDHLLSSRTIISFFVAMVFLWLVSYITNRIKRFTPIQWFNSMVSAWLACTIIITIYTFLELSIDLVAWRRLGGDVIDIIDVNSQITRGTFIALIISLIYMSYVVIIGKLKKKTEHILLLATLSAFSALFILCIPVIGWSIFKSIKTPGKTNIALALAISSAEIVGTSLAVFFHTYFAHINTYKIRQKELQIARLQQQVAQSQLDALSAKINPHFLYNSMNSIAGLATENGLKAREMAIALSKLFRYNINRKESNFATVAEEMEMATLYLLIEQIRFEERLRYRSTIEPGLENILIPIHLLQPLLENAVKHGSGEDGVEIDLSIRKQGDNIILSVKDKGRTFDQDFTPGYGLKSLYDKLDILVPNAYEIAFFNEPKEVRITMSNLKTMIP